MTTKALHHPSEKIMFKNWTSSFRELKDKQDKQTIFNQQCEAKEDINALFDKYLLR